MTRKKPNLLAAIFLLLFTGGLDARNTAALTTEDGLNVSVQACSDRIIRIRISPRTEFSESLMERYGILKTDWEPCSVSTDDNGGKLSFRTATHSLVTDSSGKTLKVLRADGSTLIEGISFSPAGSSACISLAQVINDRFSGLHVASNGGIIGDDDGSISEKDRAESGDPERSCIISIALKESERFYGGGSTSREHIQHRGEILRMHTTYQHTEIPMPFMMSSEGWGIFNNTTLKNFFDVAGTDKDRLNIYTPCDEADFFLFLGDSMPEVLDMYTLLTGRTYLLPKWAYGLCFGPNMREDQWDILSDAVNFRQSDVPCDVFWLEPQWMAKRYDFSTKKKFNSQLFSPEPYWLEDKYPKQLHNRLFIGKLRSMGYHLGLWLCEEYDLSIKEEDDIALREHRDTSGMEHWMDHLTTFLDLGVEGFKLDPARTIDEHTFRKYYNGRSDKEMHNLNQVLLPKQMKQMTQKHTGKRSWHHYTAGWSGVQHWGASTSGDNGGGKTALFDQLNLGMSGFMNTSCDVMSVPRELEMQSLHFGMFLPWVQINSWFSMMHPFYYDRQEQTLYRNAVKLRYELLPYIYSCALEGTMNGMPIVRSMPLVFPDDRNVDDCCYQYMFGPNLCVGIFTNEVYLPAGIWTDAWTGERIDSRGETVTRDYPEDRAGLLFVRDGAIIPCMEERQHIGTDPLDTFIIKVFPGQESEYTMYDSDAESYGYEDGLVSATKFECRKAGKSTEFTINAVEGRFENMPLTRSYRIEFNIPDKPSRIYVDGTVTRDWTWEDGKACITLSGRSVDDNIRIMLR